MDHHATKCLSCAQRIEGAYVRCSACKKANYCSTDCQKQHWDVHQEECVAKVTSPSDELPSYAAVAFGAPTHNLAYIEVQREKESAMMEEFYNWRKIWYNTITKCAISMLSCEQYGLEKLRTHGLAIWVSERAEYSNLDASKAYISERAPGSEWKWNVDWWAEATSFKIEYARMVPWTDLVGMLECFPMEKSFLDSFRTLCPPNKLRIVAFVAPSFLSYDNIGVSRGSHSSRLPPPRWTFPAGSQIPPTVQDLIMRTMPFFEPLVTGYKTSGIADTDDKSRFSHFNTDAWEWLIKKIVERGWYSDDGRMWRAFIDKMACQNCRGNEPIPGEVKTGLTYLAKVDGSTGHTHVCSVNIQATG